MDPDSDQWDDLNVEDTEDPLMVSEYIDEIFAYLKMIEISELWTIPCLSVTSALPENNHT